MVRRRADALCPHCLVKYEVFDKERLLCGVCKMAYACSGHGGKCCRCYGKEKD